MNCPDCQQTRLRVRVGEPYREYVPKDAPGVSFCPHCLAMDPDEDPPADTPDFSTVSEQFPTEEAAAVPMVLAIGLLTSLALYREDIDELFTAVEEAGTDPMLVLDHLSATGSVDSQIDLQGRKRQLEQLLE